MAHIFIMWVGIAENIVKVRGQCSRPWPDQLTYNVEALSFRQSTIWHRGSLVMFVLIIYNWNLSCICLRVVMARWAYVSSLLLCVSVCVSVCPCVCLSAADTCGIDSVAEVTGALVYADVHTQRPVSYCVIKEQTVVCGEDRFVMRLSMTEGKRTLTTYE